MGVQVALAVRVVEAVLGRPVERRALQGQRPRRRERPAARDARLEGPVAYGGTIVNTCKIISNFWRARSRL